MTSADGQPVVALVGTLDTKGAEFGWVRDALVSLGASVQVIDVGIRDPAGFDGDVAASNSAVAEAAGASLSELRDLEDRGRAVTTMGEGAAAVLADADEVDAVLGLGGSGGSSIFARAVRDLPLGLPKLLVSTMAAGDVGPYVGASDVTVMYSVVDVAGVNQVSRTVFGNAAAAAVGMAAGHHARRQQETAGEDRPLVAASMFGVTTPAVDAARERLEELGYEVLVFHATGSGGLAMEALAGSGLLAGVLDLTTTELADDLVGGVLTAGPDRVTAAGANRVPQVVSVGALDMVNFGPQDTVPDAFRDRHLYVHNPTVTLMRTTTDESAELGQRLGAKLAGADGPTVLMLPRGGVSALDAEGMDFHDPDADRALFDAIVAAVADSAVVLVDTEQHVNDPAFATRAADELHALITRGRQA